MDYLSVLVFDFVSSDISINVDSDPLSAMHAITSLHAPIRSFFMTHERASDAHRAFFKVTTKYKGQKLILFRKIKSKPTNRESLEDDFESP